MTTIVPHQPNFNQSDEHSQYHQSNSTDQSHSYGSGSLSSPNIALAQEPNPFERSFGVLPPEKPSQFINPSHLPSIDIPTSYHHNPANESHFPNQPTSNPIPYILPPPIVDPNQCAPLPIMPCNGYPIRNQIGVNPSPTSMSSPWINSGMPYGGGFDTSRKGIGGRKRKPTDGMDPKKILFLERNRQAALKCRLRKKKRVENTQFKRSVLEQQNLQLEIMANDLTIQRRQMKLLLQNHQNCPTYQKLTTGYPDPNAVQLPPYPLPY